MNSDQVENLFQKHLDEKIGSDNTRRRFYIEGSGTTAAARTAFTAAINLLLPIIEKQREALEFYGDWKSWKDCRHPIHESYFAEIKNDKSFIEYTEADGDTFKSWFGGCRARNTLSEVEAELKKLTGEE
jgi:hypothetical protein